MPLEMPDYLADLDVHIPQSPPLEVLHEAAEKLKEQTDGLVEGLVTVLNAGEGNFFRYTFYLLAPRLNDYTDPLFYAWHDDRLYPVSVMEAGGEVGADDRKYQTKVEFEEALQNIFAGETAKRRIRALIATARS